MAGEVNLRNDHPGQLDDGLDERGGGSEQREDAPMVVVVRMDVPDA